MTLIRVVVPHKQLPDTDYHEWVNMMQRVKADKRGHHNPHLVYTEWTVWRCNNPACSGAAYVADDFVRSWLDEHPAGKRPVPA